MYGYDILIDANLKPWLLEINASPSLTDTTVEDKTLKKALINDVFNIVMPGDWLKTKANVGTDTCKETQVGSFSVLYDEANLRAKTLAQIKKPLTPSVNSRTPGANPSRQIRKQPMPFYR